jgi:hypothetical protein
MNKKIFAILFTLISLMSLLQAVNAQEVPRMALEMSELTPGLISIAVNTQYFADLAADLDLTTDQTTKL